MEKEEEEGNKMKKMKKIRDKNSLFGGDALNSGKYVPTFKIDLFPLSSKQTKETVGSPQTAVRTYRTFRHHITDISNLHSLNHENLRNNKFKKFDVFLTVHHSIELFHLQTLMHNSLFINNMYVTLLSSTCFEH